MQVRFAVLHPDAKPPQRMTDGAVGFDLTAVDYEYSHAAGVHTYTTGLAVEIPRGYAGLLFPRSSIHRTGLSLCNAVGVVDADFRGAIQLKFYGGTRPYKIGDRIGQLVIVPVPEVQFVQVGSLSDTARGAGGFGSSGT